MGSATTAYLAIDAGGTFLKSAVLDAELKLIPGSGFTSPSHSEGSRENILAAFKEVLESGIKFTEKEGREMLGIGIAFPGPFDIMKAQSLMKHKFQHIYGINLKQAFLSFALFPETMPIHFIHDSNAVLLAELWRGEGLAFNDVAVITLGTGLGFALSENRKVLCNKIGGPYISIYAMPEKEGILEDYTARRGYLSLFQELRGHKNPEDLTVRDIGRMADEGDQLSRQVFFRAGEILARSIRPVLVSRKIQCLLFGGQISNSFRHMKPALEQGLSNIKSLEKISVVSSIDEAALTGAVIGMTSTEALFLHFNND